MYGWFFLLSYYKQQQQHHPAAAGVSSKFHITTGLLLPKITSCRRDQQRNSSDTTTQLTQISAACNSHRQTCRCNQPPDRPKDMLPVALQGGEPWLQNANPKKSAENVVVQERHSLLLWWVKKRAGQSKGNSPESLTHRSAKLASWLEAKRMAYAKQ
jgi:hypothetical protein